MAAGGNFDAASGDRALSLPEELTRQFYEWERRGRGWQVQEYPVKLEPPFRPCYYYLPDSDDDPDAGRRQTWLSRLARLFLPSSGQSRDQRELESTLPLPPEPAPEWAAGDEPIVEYEITSPPDAEVDKTTAEHLVLNLSYCTGPIAFEVVGTVDGIFVQYACQASDAGQLGQQLQAHLPDAMITGRDQGLHRAWRDSAARESVVVDFGLSQEFVRPLRTFRSFSADPLTGVVAGLSHLRENECGVFQVLFVPTRSPWAQNVFYAVTDQEGGSFFADAPEMIGLAREKISLPLYAAVIRVAAKSDFRERSMEIARGLGGGLTQFANPGSNEFIPLTNEGYPDGDHESDLLSRQSRRSGMLLNSDELVSIAHPPSASVRVAKLSRLILRTKQAPAIGCGQSLVLGENTHNGQTVQVTLSDDQRCKHMYVVGASGTGKSTFLLNLIAQDIAAGRGFAVLDPHGDLVDETLARIPESRYKDVVLFDPSDEAYPIGLNILSAHSELEKNLIASDLVGVFRRLSTSWGDQMTTVFNNAILVMLESPRGATLADLRRFLIEKRFREDFLKTVPDRELVYYWEREFPMLSGRPQVPILTRLDAFLRPKLIRLMVTQRENKIDFADIMNSGKIFLAKLAQGAIGEENAYLLGALLVSKFHQIALSRQEVQASQRRPFYLYIDEFHNFVTPSMASILSGVRKYRLGLVLAHQELKQLEKRDAEVASAALSNPFTRVCFRVGDADARKLADGFRLFEARDLQDLSTGQAIARIERADYDFNLNTFMPPGVPQGLREKRLAEIRAESRKRYATPREEVESRLESEWSSRADSEASAPESRKRAERQTQEPAKAAEAPAASKEQKEIKREPSRAATDATEEPVQPKPERKREMSPPPLMGKGGQQHKYLQNLIKRWAEGMGYRASIEKPLADKSGSIDVVLEKEGLSIACEISVTTSVDQELGNIRKCLREPFDHVVLVSAEPRKLAGLNKALESLLAPAELQRVKLCAVEELFEWIESIEAQRAGTTKNVRGYKVKVEYRSVEPEEKKSKKRAISQIIAKTLSRPDKR